MDAFDVFFDEGAMLVYQLVTEIGEGGLNRGR
jgi:hypothetical protein